MQIRGPKPHSGERGGRRVSAMVLFDKQWWVRAEKPKTETDMAIFWKTDTETDTDFWKKPTKKTKTDTDFKKPIPTQLYSLLTSYLKT